MQDIGWQFLIGGLVVSAFAFLGDTLKPKSVARLLRGAPSLALASLSLGLASQGIIYASLLARSMMGGALAFLAYAAFLTWFLKRFAVRSALAATGALVIWLAVALGTWSVCLR